MANGKTWKLTLNEAELKAVINHNIGEFYGNYSADTSARIHDLTKRLNKETPEIEQEQTPNEAQPIAEASKQPSGW